MNDKHWATCLIAIGIMGVVFAAYLVGLLDEICAAIMADFGSYVKVVAVVWLLGVSSGAIITGYNMWRG